MAHSSAGFFTGLLLDFSLFRSYESVSFLARILRMAAVFILKRFEQLEGPDRAREITRLKPHISMSDAKEAVSDAEN